VEERILVGGRRPGPSKVVFFDENHGGDETWWSTAQVWSRDRSSGLIATEDVRRELHARRGGEHHVGRHGAKEPSIEVLPGSRGARPVGTLGFGSECTSGGCGEAEAGGSPSSEAPPGGSSARGGKAATPSRDAQLSRGRSRFDDGHAVARARGQRRAEVSNGNRTACRVLVS